jgi:hypothetical protein
MSVTIGIQSITPTTGTAQGQVDRQVDDNAAKASANAVASTIDINAITQAKQSEPSAPTVQDKCHQVDLTV